MGRASFWFVPHQAFDQTVMQRVTIKFLQFGHTIISTIHNGFEISRLLGTTSFFVFDMHQILYIFVNAKNPELYNEISPSFKVKP